MILVSQVLNKGVSFDHIMKTKDSLQTITERLNSLKQAEIQNLALQVKNKEDYIKILEIRENINTDLLNSKK